MAKSTINKPEIETLSYKPKAENKESVECHNTMTGRECIGCEIYAKGKCHLYNPEQPVGCPDLDEMHLGIPNKTTEQPNQQLMLIQTIQGLTACILNSITKLPESTLKDQAYDDMNIFETGTLFRLQKEYE